MKNIRWIFLVIYIVGFIPYVTAGTPALSGQFAGSFQFNAYAHTDLNPNNPPVFMGQAIERINWEWDFDTGIANLRFDQGESYDIDADYGVDGISFGVIQGYMLSIGVPITVHSPVNFTDNGNGTYTGLIDFQVYNPTFGNPSGMLEITWEITRTNNTLSIITIDGDGNGYPGTILGGAVSTPIWGGFPFPFEPTWSGDARLVGIDSNDDGLLDAQAIALTLDPDSGDTDADGISDVTELGADFTDPLDIDNDGILDAVDPDFSSPLDSDNDGVIDALEPGVDATDASKANGLRFKGRNKARDEVTIILSLSIPGQTLSHRSESGTISQGPPGILFAFDANTNSTETGAVFGFSTSSTPGGAVTARLHFSSIATEIATLPEKILLYYVDTNIDNPSLENTGESYQLQAENQWEKIDSNTIDIRLTDGGSMDEDGLQNGIITTHLALASNSKGDFHETSGNASLSIWSGFILLVIFFLLRPINTRKQTVLPY